MSKIKLIILCTGNSVRSQMAEAFFRKFAGDHFAVYSAGFEPKGVNPFTIKVMEELGYDLSRHTSKELKAYLGKVHFEIVITVCSNAEKICPTIPGINSRIHWPFEDPAEFKGSEEEILAKFRGIRDKIKNKIIEWLKERGINPKL